MCNIVFSRKEVVFQQSPTGLDSSWYPFHFLDSVHLLRITPILYSKKLIKYLQLRLSEVYIRLAKYLVRLLYQVRNGWSGGFRQTQPTLRYFKAKLSDSPLSNSLPQYILTQSQKYFGLRASGGERTNRFDLLSKYEEN
jgi:hypothetical protein